MRQLSRWLSPPRLLIALFVAIVLLAASAFTAVQLDQLLFRHRAGRLYKDVTTLQFRRTTFAEFEPIRNRWLPDSSDRSACTEQHCDFNVVLIHGFGPEPRLPDYRPAFYDYVWSTLERTFKFWGGRDAFVQASFHVRNGRVWSASYEVNLLKTEVVAGFTVVGSTCAFDFSPHERSICPLSDLGISLPLAVEGPNRNVHVTISPYASNGDFARWTSMNLSCLTCRKPCETAAELAPGPAIAWTESREPKAQAADSMWKYQTCAADAIRFYARDAASAAVFEIVARVPPKYQPMLDQVSPPLPRRIPIFEIDPHFQIRMIQPLKRAESWPPGLLGLLSVQMSYPDEASLSTGSRWIVMYAHQETSDAPNIAVTYPCAMIHDTAENRAAIAPALAQDSRVEPLSEYESLPFE